MKNKISQIVGDAKFSIIREMAIRATRYDNVISLGIGEPDFNTPEDICRTALADAIAGHTHYVTGLGDPELTKELRQSILSTRGIEVSPEQIIITHGAMGAILSYMRTVLSDGEEVIVFDPYFPPYRDHVRYAGGKIITVPTRFENKFVPEPDILEKAITSKTKVILLNSPNNPTGSVIPPSVLDEIACLVIKHDLLVLSDEVYDRILFDGNHESIYTRPGMAERTVVLNTFSKYYAMTGWRVGYAYGPAWIMKNLIKAVLNATAGTSSVSQRAALAALRADPEQFEVMVQKYRARCDFIYNRLQKIKGLKAHPPVGSFYLLADLSGLTKDTEKFAMDLLDQQQVVVIPGSDFGPSAQHCIRLAGTVGMAKLSEAMDRIEKFIADNY